MRPNMVGVKVEVSAINGDMCCNLSVTSAGRGRQVISVCKSADLLLMVLDASKPTGHREVRPPQLTIHIPDYMTDIRSIVIHP